MRGRLLAVPGHPAAEARDGALGDEGVVPSCLGGFPAALVTNGGS